MRLFSKGVPGLDNKDYPIVKDARICHLPDRATAGGHQIVSFACDFKPCLFKNVSD